MDQQGPRLFIRRAQAVPDALGVHPAYRSVSALTVSCLQLVLDALTPRSSESQAGGLYCPAIGVR
jgi:hypothetical protein